MRGIILLAVMAVVAPVYGAEYEKCQKGAINVYEYWPWKPGTVWEAREMGGGLIRKSHSAKSLGPADGAPIRVQWDGKFLDYYRETKAGLERYKDFDPRNGTYGEYSPPAVQYPRCARLGESYKRVSRRTDLSVRDNAPLDSYDEEMTYMALQFEDVTIGAGTFKKCLMQVRDYKDVRRGGAEHRKIAISWNAPGVGIVRGCLIEFSEGKEIHNFCADRLPAGVKND